MNAEREIALVTGANKGIGFATVRKLAELGMTVYLGARDETRGTHAAEQLRAGGLDVTYIQIDVTDDKSIAAAAERVKTERGKLDVLVNNAGIGSPDAIPSEVTRTQLRNMFEINVFGPVVVTNAFLPLLRQAPAARIVNISSEVGSLSAMLDDPESMMYQYLRDLVYPTTKAAVNMITGQYAKELRDTPIKVSAAIPGYVATDFNGHTGHRTPEQAAEIVTTLATLPADAPTGQYWGSLTGAEDGVHQHGRW
ncbi:SDR family oxidoreductase [Nonomuraea sp. NPDC004186]